jgi:ribonuclease HI
MSELVLHFDGRCIGGGTPNARAGYGWLVLARGDEVVASGKGLAGFGDGVTVATSEYAGLLAGLRALLDLDLDGVTAVEARGDSQVVIRQMTGDYGCWAAHLKPLHQEASDLARRLQAAGVAVTFRWIPRDENRKADGLSRAAFDELDVHRRGGGDGYEGRGDPVAVGAERQPEPSVSK